MSDFKHGTLVFLPSGDFAATAHELRQQFDPLSAATSAPHITLTQPFSSAPSVKGIETVRDVIATLSGFSIQIGPVVTSPNQRMLWFDVNPKNQVLNLREALHDTGLFRTDLPLTRGFLPHLTISEALREPEENGRILRSLNAKLGPHETAFDRVSWIVPNDRFVFSEVMFWLLD